MTPEERYTGHKPSVNHLRIFDCLAFRHFPRENRKKLDSKSSKCLFLGYDTNSKAYRAYDAHKQKIIITKDLVFDKTRIGLNHFTNDAPSQINSFPLGSSFTNHDFHDSPESSQAPKNLPLPQLDSTQLEPL